MSVNVRHDAPIEVTIRADRKVLSRTVVRADTVDAHLTVAAYCHGGVSGSVVWHDRGTPLARAPKYTLRLVDPSFELKDGEPCPCDKCVPQEVTS